MFNTVFSCRILLYHFQFLFLLIRFQVGIYLNKNNKGDWEWEGMGTSYREQYGNVNAFIMCKFREWECE